jgi:hypothetical protein
MSIRLVAVVSLAAAVAALGSGCAKEGTVHQPLFAPYYAHDLVVPRAPPPFVIETVKPRYGYVWAHSYSRWDGHDFVLVPGQWIPEKPGYRWVDASWEQHRDGWHFRPGRWLSI